MRQPMRQQLIPAHSIVTSIICASFQATFIVGTSRHSHLSFTRFDNKTSAPLPTASTTVSALLCTSVSGHSKLSPEAATADLDHCVTDRFHRRLALSMAHASVKAEVKEEDSPVHLPGPMDEDEIYEDAGDLDFYDSTNQHKEQLYLARLPKYVWEAWLKLIEGLNDDDEVQIGTMRTWNVEDPSTGQKTVSMRGPMANALHG